MNSRNTLLARAAITLGLVVGVVGTADVAQAAVVAAPASAPAAAADASAAADEAVEPFLVDGGEGADETPLPAFTAATVHYGGSITRAAVLSRAKNWYTRNVPYNQSGSAWDVNHGKTYRTDCSGFVSMTWALTSSRTTRTLSAVSTRITWNALKPGDILLRAGHHVQVFEKWTDSTKSAFWIYEEGSTASDMNHYSESVVPVRDAGYLPYQYNHIA